MADSQNLKTWQSAVGLTEECLPLEVLERMTESSAADAKAAAHLAECPHCQTELSMLKSFEASVPSAAEGPAVAWIAAQLERKQNIPVTKPVARVSFWRTMFRVPYLAGAAALAVVLALGVSLHHSSSNHDGISSIGNGSYGTSELRTGGIHFLSPVGQLNQVPAEFRWEAFTGASSYTIELRDAIGTVLASPQTKKN